MTTLTSTSPKSINSRKSTAVPRIPFRKVWKRSWLLYVMLIPALVALLVFNVYPLWGIAIAFVKYSPTKGLFGSHFEGLTYFIHLFTTNGVRLFRNTILISLAKIILGQGVAVIFALMLHEIQSRPFKRVVQTLTTLPNFLSWVIIGGIFLEVFANRGTMNHILSLVGLGPVPFLTSPSVFPILIVSSDVWKGFGMGAVIYLAALTSINPELFEAAAVDGAGRWARLRFITLPGITPTIILLACLSLGGILNAGFDQILVLSNPLVMSTSDILDTYVYRVGIQQINYSLGATVGLLKSVIGFGLIALSYWLADRFGHYRVF
jgi:putative aldouronate transport system permease protein